MQPCESVLAVRNIILLLIALTGLVQETRENAERKQEDSEWAKPRPNKNPLEKTGAAHGIGQGGESPEGSCAPQRHLTTTAAPCC